MVKLQETGDINEFKTKKWYDQSTYVIMTVLNDRFWKLIVNTNTTRNCAHNHYELLVLTYGG